MLNVQIVTPEKALPGLDAEHVTATALDGELGIRTGHAPLVAALKPGVMMVRSSGRESWWAVAGGVMQVFQDRVRMYVERAVDAAGIDAEKVRGRIAALEAGAGGPELEWARAQLLASERSGGRRPL